MNKKVDIPCDGILGHDFLQHIKAKFCYEMWMVRFNGGVFKMVGKAKQVETKETNVREVQQIKLPPHTEGTLKIPVTSRSPPVGIINRAEIQEGVIVAASLTKIVDGYVMTSNLNASESKVKGTGTVMELDEVDLGWDGNRSTEFKLRDRERDILMQLWLEHLNAEEEKLLIRTCSDYQDIFYLPGDS